MFVPVFDPLWYMFAAWVSLLISLYSLRKKSLSNSGAAAAWIVGFFTTAAGLRFFMVLIFFFVSSSVLTKVGSDVKKKVDDDYTHSSQRTAVQVFSNGCAGTIAAILYQALAPQQGSCLDSTTYPYQTMLICIFVGHYACCNGDTWASELGILSRTPPILITTLQKVPPGTNGGLSSLGLFASFAGGLGIGLVMYISSMFTISTASCPSQTPVIFMGFLAGGVGSLIDSLLGATLQPSYFSTERKCITNESGPNSKLISGRILLDNHQVNLVSSIMTATLCGVASFWIF
eukprot:TRINITY_DN2665_c0_g1_i1.p1 TRINITY_DN2665_c0_g1~~TRINITY_DN2665_c0_g1_i1.p1  ORF type:complete len:289 (+),score=46.18 TRINITY_DN2665_c0_g1_i1:95-961(+)